MWINLINQTIISTWKYVVSLKRYENRTSLFHQTPEQVPLPTRDTFHAIPTSFELNLKCTLPSSKASLSYTYSFGDYFKPTFSRISYNYIIKWHWPNKKAENFYKTRIILFCYLRLITYCHVKKLSRVACHD